MSLVCVVESISGYRIWNAVAPLGYEWDDCCVIKIEPLMSCSIHHRKLSIIHLSDLFPNRMFIIKLELKWAHWVSLKHRIRADNVWWKKKRSEIILNIYNQVHTKKIFKDESSAIGNEWTRLWLHYKIFNSAYAFVRNVYTQFKTCNFKGPNCSQKKMGW